MSCTASYLMSFSTSEAGESQLMRRSSRKPTSNQVENMYSISTSSASRRLSALRWGCISARTSTRKRMPSGCALKRCRMRRRGDTVARRYSTSAAASSGVPTAAANWVWAALICSASATNCSLMSSHRSRRSGGVALAYQAIRACARLPPSTSLSSGSTMPLSWSSRRRNWRGDMASSSWRSAPLRRSWVERTPALPPGRSMEAPFSNHSAVFMP